MGSATRMAMCDRFIDEFAKDWPSAVEVGKTITVVATGLDMHDGSEDVREYVELEGETGNRVRLWCDSIFDPDSDNELLVPCIAEQLEISEEKTIERLKKADVY